jgi:short-subunit dehydrogenase
MQDMTRAVMPSMSARGRREQRPACCIVNISSLSAMLTVPLLTVYSATKAYVTTFSAALSTEYAGSVCVMSIEPGTARTDMCHNKHQGLGNPHPRAVAKGALDFAGTALSSFTPYFFHQVRSGRGRHVCLRALFMYPQTLCCSCKDSASNLFLVTSKYSSQRQLLKA